MSSRKFILIGIVLGGLVMANGVMAFTIKLDYGNYSKGIGGEFVASGSLSNPEYSMYYKQYDDKATYVDDDQKEGFATFCLEYNEHFSPGGIYNAALNIAAVSGCGNSDPTTPGKDNISQGTAYLYSKFASGTL